MKQEEKKVEKKLLSKEKEVKNQNEAIAVESISEEVPTIKFRAKDGVVPTLGSEGAGGFDLYSQRSAEFIPQGMVKIPTGTYVEIPKGYVGLIKCRSGHGFNKGLEVFQGVIDSDYRGEIIVLMKNNSKDIIHLKKLERFAQLVVVPCLTNYKIVEELSPSTRGEQGFGSSN